MRRMTLMAILSVGLLISSGYRSAEATTGGELLAAWALTVAVGAATLMCTAEAVGNLYQDACEDAGGHYYRDGDRWACRANPPQGFDTTAQDITGEISECVIHVIGGPS